MADVQTFPQVQPLSMFYARTVLTPALILTITSAEQTFTVPGLPATGAVFVNKPTQQAGLGVAMGRIAAANSLAISLVNPTAGSITPTAAQIWEVCAIGPRTN